MMSNNILESIQVPIYQRIRRENAYVNHLPCPPMRSVLPQHGCILISSQIQRMAQPVGAFDVAVKIYILVIGGEAMHAYTSDTSSSSELPGLIVKVLDLEDLDADRSKGLRLEKVRYGVQPIGSLVHFLVKAAEDAGIGWKLGRCAQHNQGYTAQDETEEGESTRCAGKHLGWNGETRGEAEKRISSEERAAIGGL